MQAPKPRPLGRASYLFVAAALVSGCGANPADSASDGSASESFSSSSGPASNASSESDDDEEYENEADEQGEDDEDESGEGESGEGDEGSSSASTSTSSGSSSSGSSSADPTSTLADVTAGSTGIECTSGDYWTGGDRESSLMHPGTECVSCHTSRHEGPRYAIAGTLYVGLHEPDDCNGVDSSYGAQVVITDANGDEFSLDVNSAGNFMRSGSVAMPYRAKVVYNGQERVMATPQTIGECNSCHTQDGASAAPGRIQLPL
jgi:hypothetical protein